MEALIQTVRYSSRAARPPGRSGRHLRRTTTQRNTTSVSLSALAEVIDAPNYDVISTDLFDTVVLRDHTTESND